MDNLEHEIKKIFAEHDNSTTLSGKDEMWNRLDNVMHKPEGVRAFWRVAAVFIGLLMVAGVFAGLSFHEKLQSEISTFQNKNAQLQSIIDSLISRPVDIQTKTEVVEKVVYRDRFLQVNPVEKSSNWEIKYAQLKDSTNRIIAHKENSYSNELQQLKIELESANEKLIAFQNKSDETEKTAKEPFQLKSERVELGVQNAPVTKPQSLEVKILPQSFTGNKNNINKSLLNNLP